MELENKIYLLSGTNCMQCAALKPIFYSEVDEDTTKEVNVDKEPDIAINLGVMSVPTIVDNREGKEELYTGAGPCMQYVTEIYKK